MDTAEIMAQLQAMGSESIKKILLKHGIKEPFFGVKVEHMKTIQKKFKVDYLLAKELFATGNADAMYLAGLIADDAKMSKADLRLWASEAVSNNISEYTVPWVAAGNPDGFTLALEWIDSSTEHIAATGWRTLSNLVTLIPDNQLDLNILRALLSRVSQTIHASPNRVRSSMNVFIISVGTYVSPLTYEAITIANQIGPVIVEQNGTACKTPLAADNIKKAISKNKPVPKKRTVKC